MKNKLFDEFVSPSKNDWVQQVIKDLKGKDFQETLNWTNAENLSIHSYYGLEETEFLPLNLIQQSQFQAVTKSWSNREIIRFKSEKEYNNLIISTLNSGSDSFLIDISGVSVREVEIKELLRNIKMSDIPFFLKVENNALYLVNELQRIAPYDWKGGIDTNILERYFRTGDNSKDGWNDLGEILRKVQKYKSFSCVSISGNIFHNSGANNAQEIAYTLASAIETIDKLSEQNILLHDIVQKVEFTISVGTNYFGEIAKIRALKLLWRQILVEGYGMNKKDIPAISIHCITSSFYNSSLSPHTNLLRATTEAMAAIIGGCSALSISAFDETYQESDEFSRRISRNISTILKEEAYLDKVIDPSAGSYFIENLTFKLAEKSLELLREVENMGGIVKAFEQNFIQKEMKKNFEKSQHELLNNEKVMVGVNKFKNDDSPIFESRKKESQISNVGFELLTDLRLSSVFEK
jgi:methylmalonyl-CoA mutase